MTIREHKKTIAGLKVAIAGDILHSRVARSNIHLLTKMGASVRVAGPKPLVPVDFQHLVDNGLEVCPHIEDAHRRGRRRHDPPHPARTSGLGILPYSSRILDPLRTDQ